MLQKAEKLLASVQASQKDMRDALSSMDELKLEQSLEAAKSFAYHEAPAGVQICGQVEDLLRRVIAVNKELAEASATFDAAHLEAAIGDAASFGYDGPSSNVAGAELVAKARALLQRILDCVARLEGAMSSLVASELEAALLGAKELGYGQELPPGSAAVDLSTSVGSGTICGAAEVARAKHLLERVAVIEAGLREGLETMDAPLLEGHLAEASSLGFGEASRAGVEVIHAHESACVHRILRFF